MAESAFRLPVCYYQWANTYGPGMDYPPDAFEGLATKSIESPVDEVGLVLVHCWNLGEPTGPYPLPEGASPKGVVADWVAVAHEIMAERIRPALLAARDASMPVFHLASKAYATRYRQYLEVMNDPDLRGPLVDYQSRQCLRPRSVADVYQERYGAHFPGPVWQTHPDTFDIAEAVRPTADEHVVTDGWQLSGLCRRAGVDTLVYVGFMANDCLLDVPGAMRDMSTSFRYRCVVLRDCTVAFEFADTWPGRRLTEAAIRYVELKLGYSSSSELFVEACKRAAAATEPS